MRTAHPDTGVTALMAAAAHNQADVCGHLLRLGADAAAVAANNMTALDFAVALQAHDAAAALRGFGSDAIHDSVNVVRSSSPCPCYVDLFVIKTKQNKTKRHFSRQMVSVEDRQLVEGYQAGIVEDQVSAQAPSSFPGSSHSLDSAQAPSSFPGSSHTLDSAYEAG